MTREEKLEAALRAILAASPNTKIKKFHGLIHTALWQPRTKWPCECLTWNPINNTKCGNCGKDR